MGSAVTAPMRARAFSVMPPRCSVLITHFAPCRTRSAGSQGSGAGTRDHPVSQGAHLGLYCFISSASLCSFIMNILVTILLSLKLAGNNVPVMRKTAPIRYHLNWQILDFLQLC